MPYILALDGGGTKTKSLCADETGKVLSEGATGPTSLTATSIGAASFNLKEAIRQVTENLPQGWQVSKMVMGLAGMDSKEEEQTAYRVFNDILRHFPIAEFILVNDIKIALESGSSSPNAIALISGTGSNAYGRNDEGAQHKVGGMDFLLTDQGSGYAIGRAVLRAAVKSYDGRDQKTVLEEMIKNHFKIAEINDLKNVVYNPLLSKTEVAELAKLAFEGLSQNDQVSKAILDHSIDELFVMVRTLLERLSLTGKATDCVLVGSVAKNEYIWQNLKPKLQGVCPGINVILPENGPVLGALKMALS